jgi:heme A synthase
MTQRQRTFWRWVIRGCLALGGLSLLIGATLVVMGLVGGETDRAVAGVGAVLGGFVLFGAAAGFRYMVAATDRGRGKEAETRMFRWGSLFFVVLAVLTLVMAITRPDQVVHRVNAALFLGVAVLWALRATGKIGRRS